MQNTQKMEFSHTAFNLLMQKRVFRVLLICSSYDFFMLEEDGRIDEQIFNEYTALNFRFPPVFLQADSAKKAFQILQNDDIDLVILMLNIRDIEPFDLAHQIKTQCPNTPVVILTHFSREVSLRLQKEDLSAVDYVFCWLGNADLLVAIIKLIEDRMNAEHDILQIGVQSILLVEDSVRFISQILPNLYKIIIKQSHYFAQEGLNEHQKMLRLRGRPKILLAKTFDDALYIYKKYGDQILGIISDISYKKNSLRQFETKEGLELCKIVRADDPNMPFLLQSSDASNQKLAHELNAGFLHKLSKTLSHDLQNFLIENFGFGDLIFRDPQSGEEVFRASDLSELQHIILKIPDNVFQYHASKNEISKWLNARALFAIGRLFKSLKIEDFADLDHIRSYIFDAIASYKMSKGRGVIASFDSTCFDEYLTFSRIGEGSLGGKARGLAFIDSVIKNHLLLKRFNNVIITIPRTVVIATDIFDEFMEINNLYTIGLSDLPDEEILNHFVGHKLPNRLMNDLKSFVEVARKPIAVRSSSKLEDSHYQPFAGVYATYMVPLTPDNIDESVKMIAEAIKCVYASVYFKESKTYIAATSNVIDEEKMGIILEEVCGQEYNNIFYPVLSGVARSINFYPIKPETQEDGIASIAFGLGKYIVDGGAGLRFSPKYPKKILQLSSPEMALKETQKYFYALDLNPKTWKPSIDDKINLLKLKIFDAKNNAAINYVVSSFDIENNSLKEGYSEEGKSIVTFSNILNNNYLPLPEILKTLLEIGQNEMNNPIEIEFAFDIDTPKNEPKIFYFLQIRPIVENENHVDIKILQDEIDKAIIFSPTTLGNGMYKNLFDILYVKHKSFHPSKNRQIAADIEKINIRLRNEKRSYILAGPGRWGSNDLWLGIPVKWHQISEAQIIIEAGLENYRVDPSQGTHFFQNLTSFGVGYMSVNDYINEGRYNIDKLESLAAVYETEFVKSVRFETPLISKIDGRQGCGVIYQQ